ncbi:hypothetical protein BZG36_00450 [Bifiguratus adelaidae]|uniref:VASt domain-containing protein n=1 Tax=Bifiguratus adelaidae TaxID=1938954 RepID=A0A261Y7V3_9FUNG|nr:hypothetical protein BZG36_00450 [Bifiguratus adelaidae]
MALEPNTSNLDPGIKFKSSKEEGASVREGDKSDDFSRLLAGSSIPNSLAQVMSVLKRSASPGLEERPDSASSAQPMDNVKADQVMDGTNRATENASGVSHGKDRKSLAASDIIVTAPPVLGPVSSRTSTESDAGTSLSYTRHRHRRGERREKLKQVAKKVAEDIGTKLNVPSLTHEPGSPDNKRPRSPVNRVTTINSESDQESENLHRSNSNSSLNARFKQAASKGNRKRRSSDLGPRPDIHQLLVGLPSSRKNSQLNAATNGLGSLQERPSSTSPARHDDGSDDEDNASIASTRSAPPATPALEKENAFGQDVVTEPRRVVETLASIQSSLNQNEGAERDLDSVGEQAKALSLRARGTRDRYQSTSAHIRTKLNDSLAKIGITIPKERRSIRSRSSSIKSSNDDQINSSASLTADTNACPCPCESNNEHEPHVSGDYVINGDVDEVAETMLGGLGRKLEKEGGEERTQAFHDFMLSQGNRDLTLGEWESQDGVLKRDMTYIKPLNGSIGPKETSCKTSFSVAYDKPGAYMVVTGVTTTPDVPQGNTFHVNTRHCFMKASAGRTRLLATFEVEFMKSSLLKSTIQKAASSGQESSVKDHIEFMKVFVSKHPNLFTLPAPGSAEPEKVTSPPTTATQGKAVSETSLLNVPIPAIEIRYVPWILAFMLAIVNIIFLSKIESRLSTLNTILAQSRTTI